MTQIIVTQNGSQLHVDNDFSKIFIWNNEYEQFQFQNNTGALASFSAGLLLGRDAVSGNVVPLDSGNNVNGEAIPIGVLAQDISDIADAAVLADQFVCINGGVAKGKLILENGADTVETVIDGRRLGDRIKADTKGIRLIDGDELTGFDN